MVDHKLHRLNGPAVISEDKKEWYRNGIPYREDGPVKMWKRYRDKMFVVEYWIDNEYFMTTTVDEETFLMYWNK